MVTEHARAPYSVRLELTRQCNLRCRHCLADASTLRPQNELSTKEWLAFFDRLAELQVFGISLTGGEIFLRRDIFALLERLASHHHRIDIITNGTLITADVAQSLVRLGLRRVTMSFDGMRETHDGIRGAGSFRRALEGLAHLVANGIAPIVAFTPMRPNFRDFEPLVDLMAASGVTTMRLNKLTPEGRCLPLYGQLALRFPDDLSEVVAAVARKRAQYPGLTIACSLGKHLFLPRALALREASGNGEPPSHLKDGCGACATSCHVTACGAVVPCEGLSAFVAGNIRERDLLDLWQHSEHFRTIRDLSKVAVSTLTACASCRFNQMCDAGCRAVAYGVYGDLLGPDPSCPYWDRTVVAEESYDARR